MDLNGDHFNNNDNKIFLKYYCENSQWWWLFLCVLFSLRLFFLLIWFYLDRRSKSSISFHMVCRFIMFRKPYWRLEYGAASAFHSCCYGAVVVGKTVVDTCSDIPVGFGQGNRLRERWFRKKKIVMIGKTNFKKCFLAWTPHSYSSSDQNIVAAESDIFHPSSDEGSLRGLRKWTSGDLQESSSRFSFLIFFHFTPQRRTPCPWLDRHSI